MPISTSSSKQDTTNAPVSLADQAMYLRRVNFGDKSTIRVGRGATYIDQVPEGLLDILGQLIGKLNPAAGDNGLENSLQDRLAGTVKAGGDLAGDKITTRSPKTVAAWIVGAGLLIALVAVLMGKGKQ